MDCLFNCMDTKRVNFGWLTAARPYEQGIFGYLFVLAQILATLVVAVLLFYFIYGSLKNQF